MDLEQLRRFETTVRLGTIAAAADELGITASTLCRSLKALETDCGHELFDHLGNKVAPNRLSYSILEDVRALLESEKSLRRKLDDLVHKETTICVGSCAPGPLWELARLITGHFAGTLISPIVIGSQQQLTDRLLNRTLDMALTTRPVSSPGIYSCKFCEETICASIPQDHPLAQRPSIKFKDLDGEPLLVADGIGFWLDVLQRVVPTSRFIMQPDYEIQLQTMRTTRILGFESNYSRKANMITERTVVPIDDEKAHARYWLNSPIDASQAVRNIVDLAQSAMVSR